MNISYSKVVMEVFKVKLKLIDYLIVGIASALMVIMFQENISVMLFFVIAITTASCVIFVRAMLNMLDSEEADKGARLATKLHISVTLMVYWIIIIVLIKILPL